STGCFIEHLFSRGRLLLLHVCSGLSAQSTRALLCLGMWSELNLVKSEDILKISALPDVVGDEDHVLDDEWDAIK
ncbi:hypothetical protein OG21DRAFT_1569048, partial [Imleria badia]